MRALLLKLPHQIASSKMSLINLTKEQKNKGGQEQTVMRERNLYHSLNQLFEFSKRIGPKDEEILIEVINGEIKCVFGENLCIIYILVFSCY